MDYQTFRERIGKITIPEGELKERLLEGLDTIHYVGTIGEVDSENYQMFEPIPDGALLCLDLIKLLESRGARRDRDYCVSMGQYGTTLRLSIHTTHKFLSDEDFDKNIKRYNTR